jgi:NAD(P)-dependent dehydrogenase (short-subunit alcohol dehydrogenase family)
MKVILAGGKGLIGRAIHDGLAEEGHGVYVLDLPATDMTYEPAVRLAVNNHRNVDVVINCVRIKTENFSQPTVSFPLDEWQEILHAELDSSFLLAKHFAPYMNKGGCFIFFGSIYGVKAPDPKLYEGVGFNTPLIYSVTKSAIIGMTRHLAVELAPDIRVNCISPGGVYANQPQKFVDKYIERTPLKRMTEVGDIVSAVKFLMENKYVTGQNIIVDGGFTLA